MSDILDPILTESAVDLSEKFRQKDYSVNEVLEAHLRRLDEVNPHLNAVTESRVDKAREEAAAMCEIQSPVGGVPFTAKEMFAIHGMKQTAGSIHRKESVAQTEATVVKRLREAGGILIATTNVPELGFWFECENPLYGRTNNPYDLSRTSGGSSGGEGALIGAGASPYGVGSDIGGSLRMPAAFCGVYGHKPTRRRIPLTGHFPFSDEDMRTFTKDNYPATCSGFLTRKAKDLKPLYDLLRGPDGIDLQVEDASPAPEFSLEGLPVFICKDPQFHLARRADDEIQEAVKRSARLLEQYGAEIIEFDPRYFLRAVELWFAVVRAGEITSFSEQLSPNQPLNFSKEFWNLITGRANYTVPSLITAFLEKTVGEKNSSGKSQEELLAEVDELRRSFSNLLGDRGVLLCPTHPRVAPKHRSPWFSPFDFIYTGVFNLFEGPALSCPVGLNIDGLPLSVQLVANSDRDDHLFKLAEIFESGFGGWIPPKKLV